METSQGLQRYAVATVISTLLLVALGGAVRATDSGLACPTWPGCFHAGDFVPPAGLHVWLEHTHRLVAGVVALLVAGLAGWTLLRLRHRPRLVGASVAALVLVVTQALLGAVVVWRLLQAELVTAHLALAMVIVALLLYIAVSLAQPPTGSSPLVRDGVAVAGLCYLQILVGGQLTGTGGQAFSAVHQVLGVLLAAGVGYLVVRTRRSGPAPLARLAWAAAALVVVQVVLGLANLWNDTSFVTVIPHLAVASWLWAALVLFVLLAQRAGART